ncbi:hypothetical protein LDENG_00169990, partial [Lucifuga dentata]
MIREFGKITGKLKYSCMFCKMVVRNVTCMQGSIYLLVMQNHWHGPLNIQKVLNG